MKSLVAVAVGLICFLLAVLDERKGDSTQARLRTIEGILWFILAEAGE